MKSPVVLPLPFSSPSAVVPELTRQAEAKPQPLWLALVFSRLALEVHSFKEVPLAAVAVVKSKGRLVVHTTSPGAEAHGIQVNMPVNAAYALCPALTVINVDETAQKKRLQQLADWAQQFTSRISLQAPHSLLLEIRGSLKLFGGMDALLQHIHEQLTRRWQHSYYRAVTPTPRASLLLASAGCPDIVQHTDDLRSVLGRLPVTYLPIAAKKKLQLRKTGIQTLRDVWRLPKGALARRFGAELTHYLDCILGVIPDPLAFHQQADSFEMYYEFPLEVRKADLVLKVARQMLEQLVLFLWHRDACIHECLFSLQHGTQSHDASHSLIKLGLRQPGRDYAHLCLLLQEHLDKTKLPAPVNSISLTARQLVLFATETPSLFELPGLGDDIATQGSTITSNIDPLLEQLQVRLGHDAIKTIHSRHDHRPEYAWQFNQVVSQHSELVKQQSLNRQRPLFILAEPQRLAERNQRPWFNGPVVFIAGPERIEAGWWSGKDICRDYYIGIDVKKSQLWLYQELRPDFPWYLHGLFA